MTEVRNQPVTGVTPPQVREALIREEWPSVTVVPPVATLGRMLIRSMVLAPLGWFLMLPFYFKKVLPVLATRYTLTNRRLMIQRGLKPQPVQEISLAEIDEVRIQTDANSDFFLAATLEIVSKGQVKLSLPGAPEPESFRHAILNACKAWVPGKADTGAFIPASAVK